MKMMNEPMQNVKQTMFWLSVGTVLYFFTQWLLTITVVKISNYSVAGDFALILSSSNIFYAVALFGMRPFQISDTRQQYSDKVYVVSRGITCGVAFLACVLFCIFNGYTLMQNICLLVFMIYRLTEASMDVLHGIMQNAYRMDIAGKSLIIRGIVTVILFCVVLQVTQQLLPSICAMTIFSILWLILYEYHGSKKVSRNNMVSNEKVSIKTLRNLLISCIPLLISNIVYSLILFVPRYYIELIHGTDALGVYATISAPALIVPMLALYIYTPYMPAISEYYIEQKKDSLKKLTLKLIFVISVIGIAVILAGLFFGEWGLALLFGQNIKEYMYLLLPILISVICTAFVYFFNAYIISIRMIRILLISSGAAVVTCFAFSYVLIKDNLNGASIALIVVQLAQIAVLALGCTLSFRKID